MYEDSNSYRLKINWGSLIIKAILIILFVMLILWLFPVPKLDTFYNRVFSENLKTMKDAAKNYYVGDNIPVSTGDSKTLTLEDMVNKNLIVEFVDKDNNKCSGTNSYATITKTDANKYVLKVQLSCGTETDYILENINIQSNCNFSTISDIRPVSSRSAFNAKRTIEYKKPYSGKTRATNSTIANTTNTLTK